MQVLIIEDEIPAAKLLKSFIDACENVEVVHIIDSVEEGLKWIPNHNNFDLIFSDIQLGDGLSFEIFEKLNITCPIIFTTAFNDYALKAFDLNSIAYLLKPFSLDNVQKAILKYENSKSVSINFKELRQYINKQEYRHRFLVSKGAQMIPIKTDEIAYFFTEDKSIFVLTKNKERYFINSSLDELESELNPSVFNRINRQIITSIDSIGKIEPHFNGNLVIKLIPEFKGEVLVSRRRVSSFKNWLDY